MSISALTSSQSSTISLITGTTQTQSTSATELMSQGQGIDEAKISKGGQQMKALSDLAASDPEKFKQAAQGISEALAKKASEATDSNEASALQEMADKWAESAESGAMPAFEPPAPPSGSEGGAMGQSAALKYRSGNGSNPMATMDSAVSGVLSSLGISVGSSSSSSGGASFTTSVSSTSSTSA
ncbi:hypothetical protein NNJEOMEG_00895 [Fundidesulfovibrio magnetotacticus]|uniref:Uncharacterized protein n=1 Tax=Fundidesulfovibrio magnetotacticus TaxID=2730080 RepID=A0A6V8LTC7_9BACT|nr:hypothetical protein [Fundidesulfovibrio magnetotacticus]GFK93066.1 hypothetical protein NNJEOMEG_00895 [Fundidesulfovibrio magnetotacticus]